MWDWACSPKSPRRSKAQCLCYYATLQSGQFENKKGEKIVSFQLQLVICCVSFHVFNGKPNLLLGRPFHWVLWLIFYTNMASPRNKLGIGNMFKLCPVMWICLFQFGHCSYMHWQYIKVLKYQKKKNHKIQKTLHFHCVLKKQKILKDGHFNNYNIFRTS